jgi:hypothetical protein
MIALSACTEVRAKVLRVDPLAGKLSLTLRPSAVESHDAEPMGNGDAADGGASDEEADLDEEMAARLDDEVLLAQLPNLFLHDHTRLLTCGRNCCC